MSNSLIYSALFIMIITMFGRVLGLVRYMFMTHDFGTGLEANAFSVAFTVPSTIFLFLPGALNAIFIPSLKGLVTKGKIKESKALFQKMLTISTLVYTVVTVVGMIWAEPIVSLIAPGAGEMQTALAAELLRWLLPSNLFIALIGVFSSTLHVHHRFILSNLSTVVNSGIVILSFLLLVPHWGIVGLAIGTTLGFAGAAMIMLPSIIKERYALTPNWQWNDPELKSIGERFIPIMLGSVITSMNIFIEKILVSNVSDDKLVAMDYARQVYQVPMAVFIGAFAMPLFPLLVEYIKKNDWTTTKQTVEKGLLYLWILMIPTTAGFWVLGEDIVALLFQRGEFGAESTKTVAYALVFFSLGLFPLAARDILTRAFYAMENTLTPVVVAVMQIIAYVIASVLLMPYFGFAAVALGWSAGAAVNMLLLGTILTRKIGFFIGRFFALSAIKSLTACAGMVGFLLAIHQWFADDWSRYIYVPTAIIAGGLLYGLLLFLMRETLTVDMIRQSYRKLFRRKIE